MDQQEHIKVIIREFRKRLLIILGGKLHAAYVHGAAAFHDSLPTGDIDFHVILEELLTEPEKQALEDMHEALAREYPPLGGALDGYYILLEDAIKKTPPRSEMWANATDDAWALHREHMLAGCYIVLHGGDPKEICLPRSWPEIEAALLDQIQYIAEHLEVYPDYCILNLCRLIYSFRTKDVVISKAKASEWALVAIPEWKWLVALARRSYERKATSQDRAVMLREVKNFYAYAISQIDEARSGFRAASSPK